MRISHRTMGAAMFAAIVLAMPAESPSAQEKATGPQVIKASPSISPLEFYGRLPLSFEANEGQTDPRVKFVSRGDKQTLFLTASEAVLVARNSSDVLRMRMIGANDHARGRGLKELPGKAHYFIGSDARKWRTNVPTFAKVWYDDIYPGIDLVYYGNQRQLEYDLVVRPGAAPETIALRFDGVDKVAVDPQGNLVLHTASGVLRQQKPVIYQEIDGDRKAVAGGYVVMSPLVVGFEIADYDHARPLVIDPVLVYSTYLGGGSLDEGRGIAVDAAGNAYITGLTQSSAFPGAGQMNPPNASGSIFVAKLNAAGTALVYSTYLGGNGSVYEYGAAIAVDAGGSAYVTGTTSSNNFPIVSAFQTTNNGGGGDAFVSKLSPNGSTLAYSTYLGGNKFDYGTGIAVDASGSAYVTGVGHRANPGLPSFPTTGGAFPAAWSGAFVAKLNAAGNALVYSTILGGTGINATEGNAIAVDASGSAYVTGHTAVDDFPTTLGAFQEDYAGIGLFNVFVTKLNPAGSALAYSTYLGAHDGQGFGGDYGRGIAVDGSGNAYITGETSSKTFPTTPGALKTTFAGGNYVAFVTKLNSTGSTLAYSTLLGDQITYGRAIAVDGGGNAYVTGHTYTTNFPAVDATQAAHGGGPSGTFTDAFVAKLNTAGNALWYSTYFGGDGKDSGQAIAVDGAGNAYLTGSTTSTNLSTMNAFQTMNGGGLTDAFVAKVAPVPVTLPPGAGTATIDGTLAPGEWSAASCRNFSVNVPNGTITPDVTLGTLCVMNDIANVYISLEFDRTQRDPNSVLWIEFDNDHDGVREEGDDAFMFDVATGFSDVHWTTAPPCQPGAICESQDTLNGGTNDGSGAFEHHAGVSVFEVSHPLASGENRDFALCPGQKVGFFIGVRIVAGGGVWPTDFGDTWWPGPFDLFNPQQYAELALAGECAAATVAAGQMLTTDTENNDGATPDDIVETTVTSPAAGDVSIIEGPNGGTAPSGYSFLAHAVQITAPPAPAGQYLTIVFVIDSSVIPAGTLIDSIDVARNGVVLLDCEMGANPLPCVELRRFLADGDAELTVFTEQASLWEFLLRHDVTPPSMTCSVTPNILWPPNYSLIPVVTSVDVSDTQSGADGFTLTSVTSDAGNSAGDMDGFTIGAADVTGMLRAARSGKAKNGRHYTLTYEGRDRAGNAASCSVVVTVPHDRRK